jgi:hypothetical protein
LAREARAPFHVAPIVVQFGSSDLEAPRRGRRQAKRDNLADKLTVEAKVADLKIEKAVVDGQRRTDEADLGPVWHLATLIGADNETVLR